MNLTIRHFIRLVEHAATGQPTDRETLDRIHDILHGFVSRGPVEDDLMDFIWTHWPRPATPMPLWRVHVLAPEQLQQFQAGRVTVPAFRYHSWTSSDEAVNRLALARSRGDGTPVVIHATMPADRIAIDVNAFLEHLQKLEFDDPATYDFDSGDIRVYAAECEVIVRHDAPLILDRTNTQVYSLPGRDHVPQVGDKVYSSEEFGQTYDIDRVLEQNPDGTWTVETEYHGEVVAYWVAPGEWEIVEHYG